MSILRKTLESIDVDRAPLGWAEIQNSLGDALEALGQEENGTAHLEEAISAYRAALGQRTRETAPLDWAISWGNQGIALMVLADRKNDAAVARAALIEINEAHEVTLAGGQQYFSTVYDGKLSEARAILDRVEKHP